MEDVMKKAYHVQALRRARHVLWMQRHWHWLHSWSTRFPGLGVHPVTLVTTVPNVYSSDTLKGVAVGESPTTILSLLSILSNNLSGLPPVRAEMGYVH